MWQRDGLQKPQLVVAASQDYRSEMDQIGTFIETCCETGPGLSIAGGELYKVYREWASENGEHIFTNTKFGREISKKYSKKKTSGLMVYEGITIKRRKYDNVRELFR